MNASSLTNPVVLRRIVSGLARRVQAWSVRRGVSVQRVVVKVPEGVPVDPFTAELGVQLTDDLQTPVVVSVHPVAGPIQVWSIESR